MTGIVSLVGAGPGDPELLTVGAVRRLEGADVVFHDALVSDEVLALAAQARLVDVGKRSGRPSTSQKAIHRRLVACASRGEHVVRLKGGDPFVLGRGGEEALALSAAGIAIEVVPGITSAVGVPALSGIPLTHRGLTSAFLVVSGHATDAYRRALGSLPPRAATVVVLMGLARRSEIAAFLIERGWSPRTPAATLIRGSTPEASEEVSTLGEWARRRLRSTGPGTLVIGDVVTLARSFIQRAPELSARKKGVTV